MYIIDFAVRLFRMGNIGVIVYLVLNIGLYITLFGGFSDGGMAATALIIYLITLCIALSPIGELIMRLQYGCKKIKRNDHLQRMMPLWEEVYAQAKAKDPTISDNVRLFMSSSDVPNAFATGRKTICITKGFLSYTDAQIKGTLAHEFAHLANKDTDLLLLIGVGNMLMSVIFVIWRIIINILILIFAVGLRMGFLGSFLTSFFINTLLTFFMWLWTKLGMLLVMHSSRQNEYEADKFAFDLGYGNDLCAVLDSFSAGDGGESKSFWAQLRSTHPDTDDRIAKLQEYGSSYSNMYGHDIRSINANPEIYGYSHQTPPVLPGQGGGFQQAAPGPAAPSPMGMAAIASGHVAPPPPRPAAPPPPRPAAPPPRPSAPLQQMPTSQIPVAPPQMPAGQSSFNLGDIVFALWRYDGFYYAGRVSAVNGSQIDIAFHDGETDTVSASEVVSVETALTQMSLQGNWESKGNFFRCTIQTFSGEMNTVRYDDDGVFETVHINRIRASKSPQYLSSAPHPHPPQAQVPQVRAPQAQVPQARAPQARPAVSEDLTIVAASSEPTVVVASKGFKCPSCSNRLKEGSKFCAKCGASVPIKKAAENICAGCSTALSETAKFCAKCGLTVGPVATFCSKCGAKYIPGDSVFCEGCGIKL